MGISSKSSFMNSAFFGLLCLSAIVLINAQDPACATCTLTIGTLEAGFINDDGITTNTNSTQYKNLEEAFINGCYQLVANNEEYLNFCTTGVTTFLPAIVSGLIRDFPAKQFVNLLV